MVGGWLFLSVCWERMESYAIKMCWCEFRVESISNNVSIFESEWLMSISSFKQWQTKLCFCFFYKRFMLLSCMSEKSLVSFCYVTYRTLFSVSHFSEICNQMYIGFKSGGMFSVVVWCSVCCVFSIFHFHFLCLASCVWYLVSGILLLLTWESHKTTLCHVTDSETDFLISVEL